MKLTSSAFENNGNIPSKYTCDGPNVNPPLLFSDVPAAAKSLVLIMDDPDIPAEIKHSRGIKVFDHWVIYNILPTTRVIKEGSIKEGTVISGADYGANSRGENTYTGPCPPPQYLPNEHRYFFKLYALDRQLALLEGAFKTEVELAMQGHILAKAELVGKYKRIK